MVASGGKIEEQIAQECVVNDSFGCKTEPYTFESVTSWLASDGRISESGSGKVLEYLRGDGDRLWEVADTMCADTRLPNAGADTLLFDAGRGKRLVGEAAETEPEKRVVLRGLVGEADLSLCI